MGGRHRAETDQGTWVWFEILKERTALESRTSGPEC